MAKKGINIFVGINDTAFQKGIKRINRTLGRMGKNMSAAGRSMTRNITMPLGLAGAASVKMAVDFQSSLTKIQTLVGATADQVRGYESAIKSISSTTATGQKELAEGLFFITSAGFEGEEALEALEISAKGAAMGMGEMQDIASATTSIMTGYADSGMTATRAGDLLHETLKQGKFEASEFMGSIGQVIPTAVAAGVSFEELGAATATLSKLSGDARGSLTAVNSVMMKMLTPGSEQKEILNSIGMSYDDLQSMLGDSLMGTLQHLFTELEGNNEMLVKVFGSSRAVKAAFGTMGAQAEEYNQVLQGMNESQGNVNEGFEIASKTAGFQLKKALEDVKNAGIELGAMLLPIVTKIASFVTKLVKGFTDLDSTTKKTILAIAGIGATLGPALSLIGGLFTAISTVGLPVIAAIGTLVGIGYYVYKNWAEVRKTLVDVINYFIDLYNESILFRGIIEGVVLIFKDLWAIIILFAEGGWALLKAFGNNVRSLFGGLGDLIKGVFTFDKDLIVKGFKEMGSALDNVMDPDKNPDLKAALDKHGESIAENLTTAIDNTMQKRGKIEFVTEEDIQAGVDSVGDMAQQMLDKFKGLFGGGGVTVSGPSDEGNAGLMGPPEYDPNDFAPPPVENKWKSFFDGIKQGWDDWGDGAIGKIQNVLSIFSDVANQMSQITEMRIQNEMTLLDQEQQAEIEAIEQSKLNEEDKQASIDTINQNYDTKRKALERKAAIQRKKSAVFSALLNTGMAITNALANIPAPFNIAVAATMGILGMEQVSAIRAQPLPALAEGGLAFGPTAALVGDNPGASADPEVIAPLSKLQSYMGGGQRVIVEGVIRGEDIYLTNQNQTKRAIRSGDATLTTEGSLLWR